ncbi:MAG: ATP-binding protein [Candidatus Tectomicrobia bacterium]|nr:ATP-binding protein [Candidatus Tectomicrobia bacterium]
MPALSIRARLTLWYSALLTVSMLILAGAAYALLWYGSIQDMDDALQGVARALERQAPRRENPFVPADVDALFRRFFGFSPWDRFVERRALAGPVVPPRPGTPSGTLPLSAEARRNAAAGRETYETVEGLAEYPVRVLTKPLVAGGRVRNVIQVGMSQENLYATRRRFLWVMTAVLPLGLLLAAGGGWALARRALAPVERMAEAARRISAERLAERLEESGTGDELDRLSRVLNAMLERLDMSFRQVRQFSADASHELQTPLTILQGELEVALRTPRSPQAYRESITSALQEIDRLATLVEGLLLLARADAGVLRLDLKPIDAAQLLAEVYERMRIVAQTRSVVLDLDELKPHLVLGDGERLRRLLLNLVDNAIKYTPAGGRVILSLQRLNDRACLSVRDTGIGLSEGEKEQVFQRFYRAGAARDHGAEGSGLGLCIAMSIVEAHGGTLEVSSRVGEGSTFRVCLPEVP